MHKGVNEQGELSFTEDSGNGHCLCQCSAMLYLPNKSDTHCYAA